MAVEMKVGTGYHALPTLYEPNDFISEKRFAGSLKGKVVRLTLSIQYAKIP